VKHPLAVTTSDRQDPALVARARAAATDLGLPFIVRRQKVGLGELLEQEAEAIVVFEADAVALADPEGTLRFSPGLAHLRIKQLDAGVHEDMLERVSELAEGDQVLDCTLGLAADAQVAARLVGPTGAVTGLEKSAALYLLVRHGLETIAPHPKACAVRVLHTDAASFLRQAPPRSFDVVLLDPMFERERKSSAAFHALRRHADYAPLTAEMIEHARRVARKAVVVKGSRYSSDLKKLGLTPLPARRSATVLWARLPPGDPPQ
jgi:16S rRNA (guanine1516-N2)-methyltransferase